MTKQDEDDGHGDSSPEWGRREAPKGDARTDRDAMSPRDWDFLENEAFAGGEESLTVPWQSVRPGESRELMMSYRRARRLAARLRRCLGDVGFTDTDFPELGAGVAPDGRPVVVLGAVPEATVVRLMLLLESRRLPPGDEGRSAA
ncbi:hypothetical protein [Kineosporia babensis]|uniref:Uncharacterized protein n=1 Tax=Kineosporia babensis TaxID=499548 RepID=A0A9X1NHC5_9ACTN|nr:hypothetical protein [Kineosporia babensis]MCD5313564.1 hypothetical protein [Kineosporia babensis]